MFELDLINVDSECFCIICKVLNTAMMGWKIMNVLKKNNQFDLSKNFTAFYLALYESLHKTIK